MMTSNTQSTMTTSSPVQLSSASLLWRQLMDNGIFDDCYPQRLNASFHYLCSDNLDTTAFSLKDLIQKGPYVFTYLSIDVDKDSSFAIMDIFRAFDRSGRGSVFLEEFVLGILDRLNSIKKNTSLLENIAEDLLSIESRCTELATLLEKERTNNSAKFTQYNRNLKSLSNIIRPYIRSSKATQYLSALDVPGLIRIFEQSIIHAAAEVQVFFHIPDSRMTGALADLTAQREHLKVGHQLRMIWNMNAPAPSSSSSSTAISSSSSSLPQGGALVLSEDLASSSSRVLAMNRGGGGNGEMSNESDLWMKDSPEALLSNILSGVDESRFKRLRFDGGHLPMQSQQEMMHVLKDLLPAETMAMLESGYIADNVQLHVLQDAFICINNFFQLQHPHTALLHYNSSNNPEESNSAGNEESRHSPSSRLGKGVSPASPSKSSNNNNNTNNSNNSSKKKAEVALKVQEYRELLKVSPAVNVNLSGNVNGDESGAGGRENESTVLIAVLAEDLLRTQEHLQRTQQRLKILELIQSDMMAQHFRLQEEDEEKEKQRVNGLAAMFQSHQHPPPSGAGMGMGMGEDEHSSHHSSFSQRRVNISERINNHNPRFHHDHGQGEGEEELGEGMGMGEEGWSEEQQLTLHHEESATFEEILKELGSLETCLAERSRTDYALGLLLDRPVTLLAQTETEDYHAPAAILDSTSSLAEKLGEELRVCLEQVAKRDLLTQELRNKEELLTEYRTRMEQIDIERSEWISMNAELQILREKLQKYQREEQSSRILEAKNHDLTKKVVALEEQLLSFQEIDKKYNSNTQGNRGERQSHSHSHSHSRGSQQSNENHNHNTSSTSTSSTSSTSSSSAPPTASMSSEEVEKLRDALQQVTAANVELSQQSEQAQKEISRLKTTISLSEQRVKSILQDSMILHANIQTLEEENMNSKATITKLLREVEDMKTLRQYKEESERRLFEYQKEVVKFEVEVAESRENNILINKYHNDLITAERTIESLEQKLAEYAVELEKGKIASSQLENFREANKAKLQEIRDLSLYIHQLENQLKDVPYLNTRYQELSQELAESKGKVDKIPGLLAEIARLRGSSRASIKALMEQDKLISTMKNRLKLLEKDNALLKHENQALLDLEMKVKEANQEIKRLMGIITDLQSSSTGSAMAGAGAGAGHGYGMGGQMAHKAMSIMMLNKFTSSSSASSSHNNSNSSGGVGGGGLMENDESSGSSPSKTLTQSHSNTAQTNSLSLSSSSTGNAGVGPRKKKYSQASIILPMSPLALSRANSAGGVGGGGSNGSNASGLGGGGAVASEGEGMVENSNSSGLMSQGTEE